MNEIQLLPGPVRLQLSRKKGFRLVSPNGLPNVRVDRATQWGNPFRLHEPPDRRLLKQWAWTIAHLTSPCATAEDAVRRFQACLAFDDASRWLIRRELKGKNLACWCACEENGVLVSCHADVLLAIAREP